MWARRSPPVKQTGCAPPRAGGGAPTDAAVVRIEPERSRVQVAVGAVFVHVVGAPVRGLRRSEPRPHHPVRPVVLVLPARGVFRRHLQHYRDPVAAAGETQVPRRPRPRPRRGPASRRRAARRLAASRVAGGASAGRDAIPAVADGAGDAPDRASAGRDQVVDRPGGLLETRLEPTRRTRRNPFPGGGRAAGARPPGRRGARRRSPAAGTRPGGRLDTRGGGADRLAVPEQIDDAPAVVGLDQAQVVGLQRVVGVPHPSWPGRRAGHRVLPQRGAVADHDVVAVEDDDVLEDGGLPVVRGQEGEAAFVRPDTEGGDVAAHLEMIEMPAPERPCRLLAIGRGETDPLERHAGLRRRRLERGRQRRGELPFGHPRGLVVGPPVVRRFGREREVGGGRIGAGPPVYREGAASAERRGRRRGVVLEHVRPRGRRVLAQPLLALDPRADLADGEAGGAPLGHLLRSPVAGPFGAGQRLPQGAPGELAPLVVLDRRRAEERERRVETERDLAIDVPVDDGDPRQIRQSCLAVLVHEVIERHQRRVLARGNVLQGQPARHHAGQQHLQLPALGRVLVLDGVAEVPGRGHRVGPPVLREVAGADEPLHGALDVRVGDLRQFARLLGRDVEGVVAHERRPVPAVGSPRRRDGERGGALPARVLANPVGGPVQEGQRGGALVGRVVLAPPLDGARGQPFARQRFTRQRQVGPRRRAKHDLHPLELIAVFGDQSAEGGTDPVGCAQALRRLADGGDHPERAAALPCRKRSREHLEHVGEGRRLVGEALDRVVPRAGQAVAAAEPGGLLRSELVEAGGAGLAVEELPQAAQGGDAVNERFADRLPRVRRVTAGPHGAVGRPHRHRGHAAGQPLTVVGERGVGVLQHGAVSALGLLQGGLVESLLLEADQLSTMTAMTSSPSSARRCASVGATEAPVPPTAEPTTATRPRVLSSSW